MILCSLFPLIPIIMFGAFPADYHYLKVDKDKDQHTCTYRDGKEHLDTALSNMWVFLYIYIPALSLVCLNTAIIVRLRKLQKLHKVMGINQVSMPGSGASSPKSDQSADSVVASELSTVCDTMDTMEMKNYSTDITPSSERQRSATTGPHHTPRAHRGEKISVNTSVR